MSFHSKRPLGWFSAGFAAWLTAMAGCGGGGMSPGSTSTEEATVHGKVTIKGAPARGGRIYFDPTNASRPSAAVVSAEIGKDGAYTIKTLVGENRVSVDTPDTRKDANLSTPEPYNIKSGDHPLDVTLPRP